MANKRIQVYARIKNEHKEHKARYDVLPNHDGEYDIMKICQGGTSFKRKRRTFKFSKVFPANSTQEDIFNVIAKPIIHDVFNGINATIFAYGATGSGKTYTLTGSQLKYDERGLIPRTIEYLFKLVTNNMTNYMFFISYLEIYNENAYDLLNPKQQFTCLEDLPRVIVMEDEKGEAHFKNLCLKEVNTEKEAMRLLYSGDTNRTIAETPLNDYSSRSHCVFTVHVISKCHSSGNITRSKLNLVDLAGSERLHRMNLRGMTLNEARHINLSLHYLERVIQALSHKGCHHIPYRNSMMTFILRDSLGGNCLTAMLATLSMVHLNLEESISTCKFAQRVCLVSMDANINYVPSPENEMHYLRSEIKRLRRIVNDKVKVKTLTEIKNTLTQTEEEECQCGMKQYLLGDDESIQINDMRKVRYYFELMRKRINSLISQTDTQTARELPQQEPPAGKDIAKIEKKYKQIIEQKDEEISILMSVYAHSVDSKTQFNPSSNETLTSCSRMDTAEKDEFKMFLSNSEYRQHYDDCVNRIKIKYNEAIKVAKALGDKQKQITNLKRSLSIDEQDVEAKTKLSLDQSFYREQLHKMHNIRGDIEDLKRHMNKLKVKIMDEYKTWNVTKQKVKDDSSKQKIHKPPKSGHGDCKSDPSSDRGFTFTTIDNNYENLELENDSGTYSNGCPTKLLYPLEEHNTNLERTKKLINISSESTSSHMAKRSGIPVRRTCRRHKSTNDYTSPRKCHSNPDRSDLFENIENTTEACPVLQIPLTRKIFYRSPQSIKPKEKTSPRLSIIQCKSADCIPHSYAEKSDAIEMVHEQPSCYKYVQPDDSTQFVSYLKSVPLTGDEEVDEEIIKFYRLKYKRHEIKSLVP